MKKSLVLIMTFFQIINLFGQKVNRFSKGGVSQIGNEFSLNGQYFVYTDIQFNKRKKTFEYGFNLVATYNPEVINFHRNKFRFVGFVKDSVILGVNSKNKIYSYNTVKEKVVKEYDFILDDQIYSLYNFKLCNDTLFYLKENNIQAYNITNNKNIGLISVKDFGANYSEIVSFDIKKDLIAVCVKKGNDSISRYDFYTYNLKTKQSALVKKGLDTDEKTYNPVVRLSQNQEILYSYYLHKETYLFSSNYNTMQETKKQSLNDFKLINFSIAPNGKIYLSLFNEKEREKFAAENVKHLGLGVLLSGCSVYRIE